MALASAKVVGNWQRHTCGMGGGLPKRTYSMPSARKTDFERMCVFMPIGARGLVFGELDLCTRRCASRLGLSGWHTKHSDRSAAFGERDLSQG